ncbi:hypothetical protein [Prosthecobacter sp.]|uniref:hypothetical protein n=1 Tax=Prosthecobacter sp. TaxID=1965333 RepID=UPI003784E08B
MHNASLLTHIGRILGLLFVAAHLYAAAADESRKLTDAERASLLEAAAALQKGFENGDADAIIRGTNKAITKIVSQEQFEALTRQAMASMKDVKFESAADGEPTECWKIKDGELCLLPRKSVILVQGKRVSVVAFFICVLEDGKWTFLDNGSVSKDPELLWRLFPELPRSVKLLPSEVKVLE